MKNGVIVCLFMGLLLISLSFVSASFEVNSLLLKISVRGEQNVSKPIIISSDSGGQFNLEIIGVKGVDVAAKSFALQPKESKSIDMRFDSSGISPGIYSGSIKISGSGSAYYLPVIFEIESRDVFFDANLDIPPQYSEIEPGEKIIAQVRIFDLTSGGTSTGLGRESLDLEYKISDASGNAISSESESVALNKEVQITKTVSFPKTANEGDYIFSVSVRYGSSLGISSQLFRVKKSSAFSEISGESNLRFLITLGAVILFFLIIAAFFAYIVRDRDKLIVEMKRYNAWEMKRHEELLRKQMRLVRGKKKKVRIVALEREVESKIRELRKKQEERVKELRALKETGNVKEMAQKVNQWKAKGYNTAGLEYKLKDLSVKEMGNLLKGWKKKYHSK